MDVSINKSFKDRSRQQYLTWIADHACDLTETVKIKRAYPSEFAQCVSVVWKAIPDSFIVISFKKCSISNALHGSKDDIVWQHDVEDKRNSDWLECINNDSVSEDGKSDE
jgi:hypothetical protein